MTTEEAPASGTRPRTTLDALLDDLVLVTVERPCSVCGSTLGPNGCTQCALDLARLSSLHALDEDEAA